MGTTFITHLWEKAEASLWSTPSACVVFAIIVSQFTLFLDDKFLGSTSHLWFFVSRQEDVSSLLSTIASASLSLAGLSFSSILVTMTLASGQFGPSLMRNFLKQRASRVTLGTLMGTYTYCLFILRGPGSSVEDGGVDDDFIPQISTLIATCMSVACLFIFIYFVQHTLLMIQAENIIRDAHTVLQNTIRLKLPDAAVELDRDTPPDTSERTISAGKTGYVQAVDAESLVKVAASYGMIINVWTRAGDFVTPNSLVARLIEMKDISQFEQALPRIQACFYIGPVRTPEQDIEYGLRQLVEVGLRALSPGVNDPFTAIDCIDYLGSGMQEIFNRQLPQSVFRDEEGGLRVYVNVTTYEGLLGAALNQLRQASKTDCAVTCRLLRMLRDTADTCFNEAQRDAILQQAYMIKNDAVTTNDYDSSSIQARFEAVAKACGSAKVVMDDKDADSNHGRIHAVAKALGVASSGGDDPTISREADSIA